MQYFKTHPQKLLGYISAYLARQPVSLTSTIEEKFRKSVITVSGRVRIHTDVAAKRKDLITLDISPTAEIESTVCS